MGYYLHMNEIKVAQLLGLLEKILEVDPVLAVNTLAVFLYVAKNKDCAAADICRDLKLAQPAVTRHLQRLGSGSPTNSKAVGQSLSLIAYIDDAKDARRRLYALNERGMGLLTRLGIGA